MSLHLAIVLSATYVALRVPFMAYSEAATILFILALAALVTYV